MTDITHIFGGPWRPEADNTPSPERQLIDAMIAAGLTPPETVYLDGTLHRFRSGTKGKGAGDKPGWYVAFNDGVPAGRFGCWRAGIEVPWRADVGRELSALEHMAHARRMSEAQAARDAERAKMRAVVSDVVSDIWRDCTGAKADHPYLTRKRIEAHGSRVTGDGRLVVPLYDPAGHLASLQYIDADGGKLYHAGGRTAGCYWTLGQPDGAQTTYIVEGFATGATVREATGCPVVIAYSASNLVPVCASIRERLGAAAAITIVADHDVSGTGQKYADQCAAKYGAHVIMPPDPGDVNDYRCAGGDVGALLTPAVRSAWLIPASEFCAQPAPMRWLVRHWLPDVGLAMIHGPSGGGKTFCALDWALRIATGQTDWMGERVHARGPVVYLAGEGHHGIKARVTGWLQQHGNPQRVDLYISTSGCDLNTPAGLTKVLQEIRALGIRPSMILVDTLHRFFRGDENSAEDAKPMLDACGHLVAEFACLVALVHHTGVNEDAQHRGRGSSAWRAALDVEISIRPQDGAIIIEQKKQKDAEMASTKYARLERVEIVGWNDEDGQPVTTAIVVSAEAPEPARAESKMDRHRKLLDNAWRASTRQQRNGLAYIARDELLAYLTGPHGLSDSSAETYLRPSKAGRPIADLLLAGVISAHELGWLIVDKSQSATLLVGN